MSTSDPVGVTWRKAKASAANGNCVEVGLPESRNVVLVRDTKDRGGPMLALGPASWVEFLAGVKAGNFDVK